MAFRLRVTWDHGKFCTLRVDREWSVRQVKKAVEQLIGLPAEEQRLFHREWELFDKETLLCLPPGYAADLLLARCSGDRKDWFARVEHDWEALRDAPEEVRADLEVLHAAVAQSGLALQFATPGLQADYELVAAAVQRDPEALEFADAELQADWDIVGCAVGQDCAMLRFAGSEQRADRDTVLWVVQHSGATLQFAASALRADRPLVLCAVRQCGLALQFADEGLRADREVALEAVRQSGGALRFAAEALRADREVVLAAVRECPEAVRFAAGPLAGDPEVCRAARRQEEALTIKDRGGAYAWMGLAPEPLPPGPASGEAPPWRAGQPEAVDEDEELCAEDRLQIAVHWRMQEVSVVHRWAPLTLPLPPGCARCAAGRHLWCGLCGPVTLAEAQRAMGQVRRADAARVREEAGKVERFLGAGLHFSDADLRVSSFKGVP